MSCKLHRYILVSFLFASFVNFLVTWSSQFLVLSRMNIFRPSLFFLSRLPNSQASLGCILEFVHGNLFAQPNRILALCCFLSRIFTLTLCRLEDATYIIHQEWFTECSIPLVKPSVAISMCPSSQFLSHSFSIIWVNTYMYGWEEHSSYTSFSKLLSNMVHDCGVRKIKLKLKYNMLGPIGSIRKCWACQKAQ